MNPIANRLLDLRRKGMIPDEILFLYGISGDFPERHVYVSMTIAERQSMWQKRMEQRFGLAWRRRFDNLPFFAKDCVHNWLKEGF